MYNVLIEFRDISNRLVTNVHAIDYNDDTICYEIIGATCSLIIPRENILFIQKEKRENDGD